MAEAANKDAQERQREIDAAVETKRQLTTATIQQHGELQSVNLNRLRTEEEVLKSVSLSHTVDSEEYSVDVYTWLCLIADTKTDQRCFTGSGGS